MGQDGVDRLLIALDHLEDTGRQSGLEEQFGQSQRHRGIALGRLEDECVTACQRRTGFPQRDHGREVERCDAGDDAEWLPDGVHVDAWTGALGELALHQVRNPGGELDDLDTALDVTEGVGKSLAVLDREQFGDLA